MAEELLPAPPSAVEAEGLVLSAMMQDKEAALAAFGRVSEEMFYVDVNRRIFRAMMDLFNVGSAVDPLTVMERTRSTDAPEVADAVVDLIHLAPTTAHVQDHCSLIEEKFLLRGVLGASHDAIRDVYDLGDQTARDVLDHAQTRLFDLVGKQRKGTSAWVGDLLWPTFESIEKAQEDGGAVTGIGSGFYDLDKMTSGFQSGDLVYVAARPSMGKTAFAMNVATNLAIEQSEPVAIFSLEMSKEQLVHRLLCSEARVDSMAAKRGDLSKMDYQRLAAAAGHINKAPIWIDDAASATPLEIKAKARKMASEKGLSMVIIDYLQLMSSGSKKYESAQQETTEISRSLKVMARELGVPVLALSQLSRAPEARSDRRPQLSDLRTSGSLEQDADLVLFLYRPEYYFGEIDKDGNSLDGQADLIVSKQRNGPTGTVKLFFHKAYARFDSVAKD